MECGEGVCDDSLCWRGQQLDEDDDAAGLEEGEPALGVGREGAEARGGRLLQQALLLTQALSKLYVLLVHEEQHKDIMQYWAVFYLLLYCKTRRECTALHFLQAPL